MIKKGKLYIKSHMTLEYVFTGIRLENSYMVPVDWTLTIDLAAVGSHVQTKEEIELSASSAYQKIYFWLETNLPNIIVTDVNSESDLFISTIMSNTVMHCPNSVSDDIVIMLLHSKISMLSKDKLIVGEIKLRASDSAVQYTYDSSSNMFELPTTADYFPGIIKDDTPWWLRDDGFCFEFVKPVTEESTDGWFKEIEDPMDSFYRMMESSIAKVDIIKEPAKIVKIEKWKPKKI